LVVILVALPMCEASARTRATPPDRRLARGTALGAASRPLFAP
jgi:hypothetical protein